MRILHFNNCMRAGTACLAFVLIGTLGAFSRTHADDDNRDHEGDAARIRLGFRIAPVPLNLEDKDRDLVGLGSYLVNAVSGCDDCHSAGPPTQYASNPFFKGSPPTVVNQTTYLGGGRKFTLRPDTPVIVSRNLTPDRTGRPEGGRSFAEFLLIMRTGADLDHVHPNCPLGVTSDPNCFPAGLPFNGDLLQIMPWPVYQSMSERDLRAIYEYLSAIPCITGPPTGILHNDCT